MALLNKALEIMNKNSQTFMYSYKKRGLIIIRTGKSSGVSQIFKDFADANECDTFCKHVVYSNNCKEEIKVMLKNYRQAIKTNGYVSKEVINNYERLKVALENE